MRNYIYRKKPAPFASVTLPGAKNGNGTGTTLFTAQSGVGVIQSKMNKNQSCFTSLKC
jgi:hypothetical protein